MKNITEQKRPRASTQRINPRRKRVADEVRACIARKGMKRSEVELSLRISQATLSRKLRGETAFTVDELLDLADLLQEDASTFFNF